MSETCTEWQQKLSDDADGILPPEQHGALQHHLALCAECRKAQEADRVLGDVLGTHTGLLDGRRAQAFDDGIVGRVRLFRPSLLVRIERHLRARWEALPLEFLQQMLGGTLAAASVTVICLFAAMHPKSLEAKSDAPAGSVRNEPPVPLESLLRDSSPRAARLWTSPSGSSRAAHPQPAVRRQKTRGTGQQGARPSAPALG